MRNTYLVIPLFNRPYLHFFLLCEDPGSSLDRKLLPNGYHLPAEEPLLELGEPPLLHLAHVGVMETVPIVFYDLTEAAATPPAPLGTSRGKTGVSDLLVNF